MRCFQKVEVRVLKPEMTEYRCHGRECRGCGAVTYTALPPEVEGNVFGERLTAVVAVLAGRYRLSKRLIQSALSDLLSIHISVGASEGRANGKAKRAWLWVAATVLVTVFRISTSRGSDVAKALLGEDQAGFLVTDRWCGYNWYDLGLRQLFWSHLTRDFQGFIDRGGEGQRLGELLLLERNKMFRWWHRVRDGTLARGDFQRRMKPVERRLGHLLREAEVRAETKTAGKAREILKLERGLWTYVGVEGLEPTNNFGERSIRPAVMYRKTSFGTQSPAGGRFVERVLTVLASLKQQQRNPLEFLTEAIRAHRRGLAPPFLLPRMPGQLALAA